MQGKAKGQATMLSLLHASYQPKYNGMIRGKSNGKAAWLCRRCSSFSTHHIARIGACKLEVDDDDRYSSLSPSFLPVAVHLLLIRFSISFTAIYGRAREGVL